MLRVEAELFGRVVKHRADAVSQRTSHVVVAGRDLKLADVVIQFDMRVAHVPRAQIANGAVELHRANVLPDRRLRHAVAIVLDDPAFASVRHGECLYGCHVKPLYMRQAQTESEGQPRQRSGPLSERQRCGR